MTKQQKKFSKANRLTVEKVHKHAAGIDLGSASHYAAIGKECAEENVKQFGCFTSDLEAMAEWFKEHGIETIAMEATGVYWVPVYQVLERYGFDVQVVSTRHLKMVPGRKTDIQDCQWIQHLHAHGLLRGSFHPSNAVAVTRSYIRQRDSLIEQAARHIQRMHKALEQMNVQLHKVVSDVTGETGMAIIDAIISGIRDPLKLAKLRNYRCHKSSADIAKALKGNWREEHLFCLRQEVELYRYLQQKITACEEAALQCWREYEHKADTNDFPPPKNKKDNGDIRKILFTAAGTDLTQLPGMSSHNVQTILSEIGPDVSKWPTEKHFASWVGTAPRNHITGGKRRRACKVIGCVRVAEVFRVAAQTLANSRTALGAFYRRMRLRKGSVFANAVTANKLAKLFYRILKYRAGYVEQGADFYKKKNENNIKNKLTQKLEKLGYSVFLTEKQPTQGAVS